MIKEIPQQAGIILGDYDSEAPAATADVLRAYWLTFAPKLPLPSGFCAM